MLAVTEPGVHVVTLMCATQLMKSALLENVFGYFAHLDPAPMLLLQPKEAAAQQFSRERISPMVKATPVLRDLVGSGARTRSRDEAFLFKTFPGGFLALAGAGSPDNLARRPIRVLLADEVDKYPATREGDPIALAEERTATFANWLSIRACSPTVEDESRIGASYEASDQRRASVACPQCDHRQFLEFFRHVEWEKDGETHKPKTARIYCEACGVGWTEADRLAALETARWHQTRPYTCCGQRRIPLDEYDRAWRAGEADAIGAVWEWWAGDRWAVYRARCASCGALAVPNDHAGFQASKLYSPWTKDRPAEIAAKKILAATEDLKQAWWNTQLGLPYRHSSGKELKHEAMLARCEVWPAEVPDGVALLTAGIDVQQDRVELEIVGWGRNEESWSIAYEVIAGEPETPQLWAQLDALLKRRWQRADGRGFELMAACIDSGHATQRVYEFAKARAGRRVWAVKGESARGGQRSPVWPTKRRTSLRKGDFKPTILGVNSAKDVIRARLALETPGPGYMHFPADRDLNYFGQLTAERLVTKVTGGHRFRVWELPAGRANEALDARVYAYAALCGLQHLGLKLNRRAAEISPPPSPGEAAMAIAGAAAAEEEEPAPELPGSGPTPASIASTEKDQAERRRKLVHRLAGLP